MAGPFRHPLRLVRIAWVLARHDALAPLAALGVPAAPIRLLIRLARRPGGRAERPGVRLAAALQALGPSFVKLGQALSVRPDLVGPEVAEDLGRLRDRLPPFPAAAARDAVAAELGQPVALLFAAFEDRPAAAASIAQVHFAVTEDGREVAVKVLRPDVEAAFAEDLELMRWLAGAALRWRPRLARLRPVQVVETLARSVALELDLRMEAAAAAELAQNLAGQAGILVPAVDWQRTGRRVLTTQRVHGIPVDDRQSLIQAGHDMPALAAAVIRSFLHQVLEHGFFHADMHHGNLFVTPDGRLAMVDFGIMGRIDRPTRLFMAELLHAFLTGDWRRAAEVHYAAGYVPAGQPVEVFAQACRSIGEPILGRPVSEISIGRLLAQLFRITETFDMPVQPSLLLLQKTMVTAEGVARTLDPDINFWEVSRPIVADWMAANLGPEARLRDLGEATARLVSRLPDFTARLERAAAALDDGLRLEPETARLLAHEQARGRRPLTLAVWTLAALLGLTLLLAA